MPLPELPNWQEADLEVPAATETPESALRWAERLGGFVFRVFRAVPGMTVFLVRRGLDLLGSLARAPTAAQFFGQIVADLDPVDLDPDLLQEYLASADETSLRARVELLQSVVAASVANARTGVLVIRRFVEEGADPEYIPPPVNLVTVEHVTVEQTTGYLTAEQYASLLASIQAIETTLDSDDPRIQQFFGADQALRDLIASLPPAPEPEP